MKCITPLVRFCRSRVCANWSIHVHPGKFSSCCTWYLGQTFFFPFHRKTLYIMIRVEVHVRTSIVTGSHCDTTVLHPAVEVAHLFIDTAIHEDSNLYLSTGTVPVNHAALPHPFEKYGSTKNIIENNRLRSTRYWYIGRNMRNITHTTCIVFRLDP
jgi:hypothetical protein